MPKPNFEGDIFSVREVADMCGITPARVNAICREWGIGQVPKILGRRVLTRAEAERIANRPDGTGRRTKRS